MGYIDLCSLMGCARDSNDNANNNGEGGQPCRVPLCNGKGKVVKRVLYKNCIID